MSYLDAVKKWPAAYGLMASVMDDVSLDDAHAIAKWGDKVVELSTKYNGEPVTQEVVDKLVHAFAANLSVALIAPATTPSVSDVSARTGRPAPGRSGGARPAHRPSSIRGVVTLVTTEEKAERYGGGVRHVMEFIPHGYKYPVRGTIPSSLVGKVKAGDSLEMEAEYTILHDRPGWYRYPKNPKILTVAS